MVETSDELTWTQVPPTSARWMWLWRKGMPDPKLVQVFGDVGRDGKECLRYSFYETPRASHLLLPESKDLWWFGPVQDPPKAPAV